jgi:hypothetical protein
MTSNQHQYNINRTYISFGFSSMMDVCAPINNISINDFLKKSAMHDTTLFHTKKYKAHKAQEK